MNKEIKFRNFSQNLKKGTSSIFKTLNFWSTNSTKCLINFNSYITENTTKRQQDLYYLDSGFPLFLQSHEKHKYNI